MILKGKLGESLSLTCLLCLTQLVRGVMYTAGVVEFAPEELLPTMTPQQLILLNADKYTDIIETAADHGVDILVFPECGLTGINIPTVRDQIFLYVVEVPDVGVNPCASKNMPEVLTKLSCAAKSKKLYMLINLSELVRCDSSLKDCPPDGSLFYNTNIVFDRCGTIVAKYRKTNLFIEPEFSVPKSPDHTWFDTDFGVRFGTFICFDLLFSEPSVPLLKQNISNFVYATAWFSEMPYFTAASVQAGWAYINDVNFLTAGYSNVSRGLAGSGIFAGTDGTLVATLPKHSSTKLLIAKVSSDQRGVKPSPPEQFTFKEVKNSNLIFSQANFDKFTSVKVTGDNSKLSYENEGFSCNVNVKLSADFSDEKGPKYRLVAYSGLRILAEDRSFYIEVCGVVACADDTLASCSQKVTFNSPGVVFNNIAISAVSRKNILTYPITLDQHFLPLQKESFNSKIKEKNGEIYMTMDTKHSVGKINTFSIVRKSGESEKNTPQSYP